MFGEHSPCGGFPLVLSGSIRVLQRYPNGRELQLYRVKPGESCLLSGSCLLGDTNYAASGIAETDVELLILPPALFQALIAEDESFRRHVFEVFGERLAALMQVVEAIAYQKLDQRLAALLVARTAGSEIHATHQALADELGQRARDRVAPAAQLRGSRLGRPRARAGAHRRSRRARESRPRLIALESARG